MRIQSNVVDKRIISEQPVGFLMCMPMQIDHVPAEVFIIKVGSKNRIMAQEQRQFAELYKFASRYTRCVDHFPCCVDGAQLIVRVVVSSNQENRPIQTTNNTRVIMTHYHVTKMINNVTRVYDAIPAPHYFLIHLFKRREASRSIKEILFVVKMSIRCKKDISTHELSRPPLHSQIPQQMGQSKIYSYCGLPVQSHEPDLPGLHRAAHTPQGVYP